MNRIVNTKFVSVWEEYLINFKKIIEDKLDTRRKRRRENFKPLIDKTFDLLLSRKALDEFELAASGIDSKVILLYQSELEIFNSSIKDNDYDLDEAIDDGEQAKGSAEKIFDKLPKWVRDILKVLNEIIKMIRGS